MQLFIKDRKSFVTKFSSLILDYEIKPSIYDTVSTYTIPNENLPNEGDFVYDEDTGFIGVIGAIETERQIAILSVHQIHTIFSRKMIYQSTSYTYLETYLKTLIDNNFTNCTDTFYAMPFLNVTALTSTASTMTPDVDDYVYSVSSFMAKARRLKSVFCEFDISRTQLGINITTRANPAKNIDFSNPSFYITEQNISSLTVSKITSYCEENSQVQNWTLLDDGTIVNTSPATGRVDGEWTTLIVNKAADVQDKVNDEFAKNYYSHNITFQCPLSYDFKLYDNLQIKIDGKIFTSYVAQMRRWKNSKVQEIQCGELQVKYPYLDLI